MNDWAPLKRFTQARIGLARAGAAISTTELLRLQLAHAQARDAVWRDWDASACALGLQGAGLPTLLVTTQADNRETYLERPDLGRRLSEAGADAVVAARQEPPVDVALIVSDGLSATAVGAHAIATLTAIHGALSTASLTLSPIVLAQRGRVALSDEIGQRLGARISVIVLGERPGLSAADSLGIYMTHSPMPGNSDAQRNCISNVREPGGLPPAIAARRLAGLLTRSLALGASGVALKDDGAAALPRP